MVTGTLSGLQATFRDRKDRLLPEVGAFVPLEKTERILEKLARTPLPAHQQRRLSTKLENVVWVMDYGQFTNPEHQQLLTARINEFVQEVEATLNWQPRESYLSFGKTFGLFVGLLIAVVQLRFFDSSVSTAVLAFLGLFYGYFAGILLRKQAEQNDKVY